MVLWSESAGSQSSMESALVLLRSETLFPGDAASAGLSSQWWTKLVPELKLAVESSLLSRSPCSDLRHLRRLQEPGYQQLRKLRIHLAGYRIPRQVRYARRQQEELSAEKGRDELLVAGPSQGEVADWQGILYCFAWR